MSIPFTSSAVVRCGFVSVKKSGISLRRWKKRWLVLTSNIVLATARELISELALGAIKDIFIKEDSPDRHRCLQLMMRGGPQFYLAFESETEFDGWYDDIFRRSPLASVLIIDPEEGELDEEDIINGYLDDDWASISSPSTDCSPNLHRSPNLQISSTPNLLNIIDSSKYMPSPAKSSPYDLTARDRDLVRRAITFLCSSMEPRLLRRSDPGGEKPFDLVEIRLRTLLKVKKKWRDNQYDPQVDRETIMVLSETLSDGYILCRFLNAIAIGSSPIIRPNDRDNVNITMFLTHCRELGIAREELFSPGDLTAATAESSVIVARTILTLAKMAETDPQDRKTSVKSLAKFSKNLEGTNSVLLQRRIQPGQSSIELEESLIKFIASRRRKKSLRYDNNKPTLKVLSSLLHSYLVAEDYTSIPCTGVPGTSMQNVVTLLENEAVSSLQGEGLRLKEVLVQLVNFMASLDTISSLVESRQFRIRLLQFSASLHSFSDHQLLREALKKDEIEIISILRNAVHSDEYKQVLVGLQGEDAQSCVDLIQEMLDRRSLLAHNEDDTFYHQAQRLLVKLSERSDTLPTSLFIKGVTRRDPHACTGGTFADIYRAVYRDQDVALKKIRIFQGDNEGRHKSQKNFCREALLWQRLHHPFVLPFCGIDSESFPSSLCMVSPWMRDGTILRYLNEYAHVNVEQKIFEIAQGLNYLHSMNLVHGDLRGSNILIDDEWHVCLADFGLAVFGDGTLGTPSHQGGSTRWMAPELHHPAAFDLLHFKRTFASDVYSFACVAVELFTGRPPFPDIPHDSAVMLRVMAGERPERPAGPRAVPDRLWDVIQLCWRHNPRERPSMSRVIEMMKVGNGDLREVSVTDSECLDWDISLHSPGGSNLVRRRKFGSQSARAGRPSGHKPNRSS
ncbi:hypothetical protein D9757_005805 [Collybiopsis confluens]|uniref:Non-specific serine/threonine protein kinase n=1 Tax=Collybiopsis confluens TaxID=2823264 RepID=A0A8H5HQ88_9AGAR|nr:hypothetical protein D9757_005805 [Collybiopsis confluens]